MAKLTDIKFLKKLLEDSGLRPLHGLGQNFIVNLDVISKMVIASGVNKESSVLEIGSGIGTLTKELAKISKKVVTIEIDKKLVPLEKENLKNFSNISLINDDFLKLDLNELWERYFAEKEVFICANLPYYITSPIIFKILKSGVAFKTLTIMVQKELAERICTVPGTRSSSAISYFINYFCETAYLFTVGRGNFFPIPKVDSAVIKLTKRLCPPVKVLDKKLFFRIIKESFSKRRKKLVNSINEFGHISKKSILEILKNLDYADLRPENLTLEDFAKISNAMTMCSKNNNS